MPIPSPSSRSAPLSTGSGISTGSADSNFSNSMDAKQRRRKRRTKRNAEDRGGGGGGSVLWTILIIGLTFCLIDVFYIIGFVDRQHMFLEEAMGTAPVREQTDSSFHDVTIHGDHGNTIEVRSGTNKKLDQSEIDARKEILDLISEARVKIDLVNDADMVRELPTWEEVTSLYGKEPVIYGLDQCEVFRQSSDPADHFVSTAGTFNTGTNLMAELLIANCHMQARMDKYGSVNRGVRWQVPWGKHTPPGDEEFRQTHKTLKDAEVDANNIFPAVTIRDPLVWLKSMCKHSYAAHWDHGDNCPDFSLDSLGAHVKYAEFIRKHDSILHLWNDYYTEYMDAKFPRLIVRFEDLVFHPKEVTKTVCECAGGSMRPDGRFKYIVDSAKKGKGAHGNNRTGYIDALIKYGSAKKRYSAYSRASDLEYIRDHLDPRVMDALKYPSVDPAKASSS